MSFDDENPVDYDTMVLLKTIYDLNTAYAVEALLKDNGIPVMLKHEGSGEYLKLSIGITNFGVDIFVPASLFEEASELIKEFTGGDSDNAENALNEEEKELENKYSRKRRIRAWIILMFFAPGLAVALLILIFKLILG